MPYIFMHDIELELEGNDRAFIAGTPLSRALSLTWKRFDILCLSR